jgi:mRNA deadenylase 3'-5' endonuclease subunit Ccr4
MLTKGFNTQNLGEGDNNALLNCAIPFTEQYNKIKLFMHSLLMQQERSLEHESVNV